MPAPCVRLYRGLKRPYRPDEAARRREETRQGVDFTDCPRAALSYASTPRGVLLVVDLPPEASARVTEELWPHPTGRRFMIWGAFDRYIRATIPAKELRADLRRKQFGMRWPLECFIEQRLRQVVPVELDTPPDLAGVRE